MHKHTRKIQTATLATLVAALLTACSLTQHARHDTTGNTPKQLKVLSWNVWNEGHTKLYGKRAADGMLGILRQSQADVVIMVETYGASDMVADALGFYHRLLSSNLSVYSRYPIVETYTFKDSIDTFNFGGVRIDMDGQPVRVFPTWITYLPDCRLVPTSKSESEILAWDDAGKRDEQTRTILNVLKPFVDQADSIPLVVGGDFNIHSHLDWTEATRNMFGHGGAAVRWTVSSMMQQAGFKDSFREVHPDPTKYIGTTWLTDADSLETPNRHDRIDFIYYQGAGIHAVQSDCIDTPHGKMLRYGGRDFFYPSDHGFVTTTFCFDKPHKR